MKKLVTFAVTGLLLLSMSRVASASIITYSSNTPILTDNSVTYTSNFNDYAPGNFYSPGNIFTRGGVTYTSGSNMIVGSGVYINNTGLSLMFCSNWSPLTGTISTTSSTTYDKFGFDIGQFGDSPITINLTTNLNTIGYTYSGLTIVNAVAGNLQYLGYQASAGEYFTGFSIIADNGGQKAAGITNVTVATSGSAPTPEPSTWALLGIGALLAAFRLKKFKHSAVAV